MAAAKPWMKFYPRDWRADEKLRDCTLAARGLWIEMLSIMHASDRYGRLLIAGKTPSAASLARQVGASESEVSAMLDELREADVFSTDHAGIIYSRRMKQDEKRAENASRSGKMGGNPKLCNKKGKSGEDKGQDKDGVKGGLKLRGQSTDKKTSVKKGIPDGWKPEPFGEETQSRAIVDAWPDGTLATQAERFRAHHTANGSKFTDWQQAWSTWVLNSVGFERGRPAPKPHRDFEDIVLEEAERRKAVEARSSRPAPMTGTG